MSPRHTADRLRDILTAIRVIERYRRRGSIEDELVFDGYRMRLIEIGEAAKDLPAELKSAEPDILWREIARMRDHLSHRYFDTQREIVERVPHGRPQTVGGCGDTVADARRAGGG